MFTLLGNAARWVRAKRTRPVNIVLIGLDNAGKTTLLASLQGAVPDFITPTWGFSSETLAMGKHHVTLYDLGGGERIRGIWRNYYAEVHGIVFVVDAGDRDRLPAAAAELRDAAQDARVAGKPILVFANKQDVLGAASPEEVGRELAVAGLADGGSRFHVVGCTALPDAASGAAAGSDGRIRRGIAWLLGAVDSHYGALRERVERESAEQKERERVEFEEKRARVQRIRDERAAEQARVEREEAAAATAAAGAGARGDVAMAEMQDAPSSTDSAGDVAPDHGVFPAPESPPREPHADDGGGGDDADDDDAVDTKEDAAMDALAATGSSQDAATSPMPWGRSSTPPNEVQDQA